MPTSGAFLCVVWGLFVCFAIVLVLFATFRRRAWRDALLLCHCLFLFMSALILSWGALALVLFVGFVVIVITILFSFAGIVAIVRDGFSFINALAPIFLIAMWALHFLCTCPQITQGFSWFGVVLQCFLFFINFCTFFTLVILFFYSCVYSIVPKRNDVRYIIILGAGIIVNKPSPLLKNRLDAALKAWDKGGRVAKLVCSGGQGKDEIVSEASVMAEYLRQKGVPEDYILLEDKSKNTLENMEYSKSTIETDAGEASVRCLFVTNNFHVLRAAFYARRVHLDAEGLACKTALWYWPSMFIREYVALVARHWFKFLLTGFVIFCVLLALTALYLRLVYPQ